MKQVVPFSLFIVIAFTLGVVWPFGHSAGEGRFGDLTVVFFLGGPEEDELVQALEHGARDAAHDLGPRVTYVRSDWDVERMTEQFIQTVRDAPDCIVIPGHPGAERLGPHIRQAVRDGITVTTVNVPIPEIQTSLEGFGFGFVGQDQWLAGAALARAVTEESGAASSVPVILFGVTSMAQRSRRTSAIQATFLEAGHAVRLIKITEDMQERPLERLAGPLLDAIRQAPGAIVVIDGPVGHAIPEILEAAAIGPDEHFVAVYDLDANTTRNLRSGYLDLVADQQGYLQGYLSILQACFASDRGSQGLTIDTGISFLTRKNLPRVARPMGRLAH